MLIICRLMVVMVCLTMPVFNQALADTAANKVGAGKVIKEKKCQFPKSRKRAPNWVCTGKDSSMAVTAVGSFHKSAAGIAFMEQMAATDARVNLAQKLHDEVQKEISARKGLTGKQGVDRELIKKITDEELQGTKILKSIYSPKGTLYMLIGIEEESAQKFRENIAKKYFK